MSSDTKTALYTGAFWAVIAFIYAWSDARSSSNKFNTAAKAALWAFVVMGLFSRGCSAIAPTPGDGPADCERYPGIIGC